MPGTNANDSTSETLLKRVQDGNQAAWVRFERLYRPLILYWCQRGGVDANYHQDIAQEVFLKVQGAVGRFTRAGPKGTLRGWLFTITRNCISDYHKARKKAEQQGRQIPLTEEALERLARLDEEEASPKPVSQRLLAHSALALIRGEFTENGWQAFLLHGIEKLSAPEVATRLGMTAQAVRAAKARVLRRLRKEFGDIL